MASHILDRVSPQSVPAFELNRHTQGISNDGAPQATELLLAYRKIAQILTRP
jgi:hypothetical protein